MSQTHPLTTTTFDLPGYRVTKSFGVVRGIIVRSRSIVGNIGASIQSLFGGNISLYTSLCERARDDAFREMLAHAGALGANAVVGVRYDATEIAGGVPLFYEGECVGGVGVSGIADDDELVAQAGAEVLRSQAD